jgi:F-type H+-transporting ATPase subunit delta
MAKVNDREMALARVYSRAMLSLADEVGETDELLAELQELVKALDQNPELERFLASPLVEDEDRAAVLEKLFRGRASDLLVDSLQVVNRKGRLGVLRAIAEGYRIEHRDLRGIADAHVRTAVPLSDALRGRVREAVARFTGKQAHLFEKVDPAILGGIVIEVDGRKIDGSVASRLRELGQALEQRASEEIVRSRSSAGGAGGA